MVIGSDLKAARQAERRILDELARFGYSDAAAFAIRLALEEGLNNAINHGNRRDASRKVAVAYDIDAHRTSITITDQGNGFDPAAVPDPRADENLEKPAGRGIMLMHAYMDEVHFNELGNQVHMVKLNR
jgi:serine/threonine-protein kinase RsbW